MLLPSVPMSNAERQRRFRSSHPGYNRKYSGHPTAAQRRQAEQVVNEAIARAEAHERMVLDSTLGPSAPADAAVAD